MSGEVEELGSHSLAYQGRRVLVNSEMAGDCAGQGAGSGEGEGIWPEGTSHP